VGSGAVGIVDLNCSIIERLEIGNGMALATGGFGHRNSSLGRDCGGQWWTMGLAFPLPAMLECIIMVGVGGKVMPAKLHR